MTDFITSFENWITTTEADVQEWIVQIKAGVAVAESDINAIAKWVASETPTIVADLQSVLAIVTAIGVGSNPDVALAIEAANAAVTALNAFAAAQNAGKSTPTSVVAGYVAVKTAQSAAASAAAAAVVAPVTGPVTLLAA